MSPRAHCWRPGFMVRMPQPRIRMPAITVPWRARSTPLSATPCALRSSPSRDGALRLLAKRAPPACRRVVVDLEAYRINDDPVIAFRAGEGHDFVAHVGQHRVRFPLQRIAPA